MPLAANVQSIEALKLFRVSLCKFAEAARSSLGEAEADLQRHANWLSDDRQRYWRVELTRRTEAARRAKMTLLEKKLQKTAGGGRSSCVDEEKALALAERRLEEAHTKGANTKRWIRQLDEEIFQYKGLIQALNHALDVDFVKILTMLDGMIDALDRYVSLAPPPGVDFVPVAPEDVASGESQDSAPSKPEDRATEQAPDTALGSPDKTEDSA
jgi:hypothetical protein